MGAKTLFRWTIFCAGLVLLPGAASLTLAQEETATLEPLAGEVRLRSGDSGEWQVISGAVELEDGVEIQTDASGRALLTYGAGLSTEMLGNTHILLDEIEYSEDASDIEIVIEMLAGDTFNSIDGERAVFEVHTPTISTSTRASQWYIATATNGDSMIAAVDGSITVERVFVLPFTISAGQTLVLAEDGNAGWLMNSLVIPLGEAANNENRFDFARELACLRGGQCDGFCALTGSAPLCDAVTSSGFVNCTESARVDSCAQILSERPAATIPAQDWRVILADRIANIQSIAPAAGNNPPGADRPSGDGPPGSGGPPARN